MTAGGATQHFASGGFCSAARSRLVSESGRLTIQTLLLRSVVRPETWPSSQLFGRSLGQSASTWNCGTPALGVCASTGVLTNARRAPAIKTVPACIMSSLCSWFASSLRHLLIRPTCSLSDLRHALLARCIEREDPGAVEKRRRRHLAIIGELLARLQRHARGARLALSHIGPKPRLHIIAVTREVARQHIAVLDCHVAALRQRRHGRMRGVAEQRHPAARPFR